MEKILWQEKFNIDNEKLNSQHQKLVKILNSLIEHQNSAVGSETISELLTEIMDYTRYHFSAEERYMATIGYPNLDAHKREHKKLLLKTSQLCVDVMDAKPSAPKDILEFLSQWLVDHILHTDQEYNAFSRENEHCDSAN